MIYEHCCELCEKTTDDICKVYDRKKYIPCSFCEGRAKRVISNSQGIQDSDPTWLGEAVESAVAIGEKNPPRTRQEYNKYCKDHRITCTS